MDPKRFSLYGNTITPDQDRKALNWQQMFVDKFDYDPHEHYELSVHDNPQLGDALGIRDIRRDAEGDPIDRETGIVISTIRMGYGHYRIGMAGASAARGRSATRTKRRRYRRARRSGGPRSVPIRGRAPRRWRSAR